MPRRTATAPATAGALGMGVGLVAAIALLGPATGVAGSVTSGQGPAPAQAQPQVARIVFGLQRDIAGLQAFAAGASAPGGAGYRNYMSVGQLARRFGATPATVRQVRARLRKAGFSTTILDVTHGFLIAPATAAQLQSLEGAGSQMGRSADGQSGALASLKAGMGGLVTEIVSQPMKTMVHPHAREAGLAPPVTGLRWPARTGTPRGCTQGLTTPMAPPNRAQGAPADSLAFAPNQFQAAFGMAPLLRAGVRGQGQHVALFEADAGFKRADIEAFAQCYGLPAPNLTAVPVGQSTPVDPMVGGGSVEAHLDIVAVMSAAPRARISVVQGNALATMPEIMSAALDARRMRGVPQVISSSYGVCEPLGQGGSEAPFLSGSGARRLTDWVLASAAGAGVTVVVAAGDSGAQSCAHNVGGVPLGPNAPLDVAQFATNWVEYPSSSPWITAVGGTDMTLTGSNALRTQSAWNDRLALGAPPIVEGTADGAPALLFAVGSGSGGTSLLYGTPGWQSAAGITSNRRAVPDVSMYASWGIPVVCSLWDAAAQTGPCPPSGAQNWPFMSVAGTSFAAPLLAGAIALANQGAAAAGQPPAGFLNPLLYGPGRTAVRDVTQGNNDAFGTGRCCFAGRGYDQATGLGTVNAAALARAVIAAGR